MFTAGPTSPVLIKGEAESGSNLYNVSPPAQTKVENPYNYTKGTP